jgi:hypothetical protein
MQSNKLLEKQGEHAVFRSCHKHLDGLCVVVVARLEKGGRLLVDEETEFVNRTARLI